MVTIESIKVEFSIEAVVKRNMRIYKSGRRAIARRSY